MSSDLFLHPVFDGAKALGTISRQTSKSCGFPDFRLLWNIDYNLRWKMTWPECRLRRFSNTPEIE
jgi:hypothetical protein